MTQHQGAEDTQSESRPQKSAAVDGSPSRNSRPASERSSEKRSRNRSSSRRASEVRESSDAKRGKRVPDGSRTPQDRQALEERRARRARARRKAKLRRRNRLIAIGVVGLSLILVMLFLLGRCVVSCVSNSSDANKDYVREQTVEDDATTEAAEPESEEDSEKESKTKAVKIDLVMIGDILQHAGVYQSGFKDDGSRNYDHIFKHIRDQLKGADIKVVNQETLLGGESFEFSGYPTFNGPQEMGDAEVKAGFNVVLRATNHALDMGYDGLTSELSFWRTKHPEVAVIGAVDPEDSSASVNDVYVFEKDGFKVALLNYTYDLNGFEDPLGVVSMLDEKHVRKTIKAARKKADMVVVFPHWGEEYNLEPVESQYEMADLMIECGADVIIGGHPHVIEPVEILTASDGRKVPCFWSVGNFVSTQVDNENLVGGLARVTLQKDAEGNCSVEACSFVPTVTHKGEGKKMTTYLLSDYTDKLAASNYLEYNGTDNTSLTVDWANEFCKEVLGKRFDTDNQQLSFSADDLKKEEPQKEEEEDSKDEAEEELDKAA